VASVPSGTTVPLEPGAYTVDWRLSSSGDTIRCPNRADIIQGSRTTLTCEVSIIPVPPDTATGRPTSSAP
jgi:hypothetical protein